MHIALIVIEQKFTLQKLGKVAKIKSHSIGENLKQNKKSFYTS